MGVKTEADARRLLPVVHLIATGPSWVAHLRHQCHIHVTGPASVPYGAAPYGGAERLVPGPAARACLRAPAAAPAPRAPGQSRHRPGHNHEVEHRGGPVSVPEQGGFQACRVPFDVIYSAVSGRKARSAARNARPGGQDRRFVCSSGGPDPRNCRQIRAAALPGPELCRPRVPCPGHELCRSRRRFTTRRKLRLIWDAYLTTAMLHRRGKGPCPRGAGTVGP